MVFVRGKRFVASLSIARPLHMIDRYEGIEPCGLGEFNLDCGEPRGSPRVSKPSHSLRKITPTSPASALCTKPSDGLDLSMILCFQVVLDALASGIPVPRHANDQK